MRAATAVFRGDNPACQFACNAALIPDLYR